MDEVVIYTDGGCDPNPGPGGWGAVLLFGEHRRELYGGYRRTTNNRMELLAAIRAIEALKRPCVVALHSDSRYLVDAMSKGWIARWKSKGWRRSQKLELMNADLWQILDRLCGEHRVSFQWVRGHSGIEENERADALATRAIEERPRMVDEGYEE